MRAGLPIEDIVAGYMSQIALMLSGAPLGLIAHMETLKDEASEALARDLLRNVSDYGKAADVLAALAAVGAPATLDEIGQSLQAARDAQRPSAKSTLAGQPAGTDTGH